MTPVETAIFSPTRPEVQNRTLPQVAPDERVTTENFGPVFFLT
jgi:hypothetical protein